ncbi:MAG: cob(I)yrinic acid a,c-diamide adenosyltransferase [Candidatus Bathyarchaeia archaeon]
MGKIFLYYGTGAGKTTNALGLALRCVGHGLKAVIIQFMKGRKDIGEYQVMEKLKPHYEIYQFGRSGWVDLRNPSEEDKALARKGLEKAEEVLKSKPHLLVLDEICLAAFIGLIDTESVLKLLSKVPDETDVILTGRYCPPELINRADIVNMVVEVKAPREIYTRIGITH